MRKLFNYVAEYRTAIEKAKEDGRFVDDCSFRSFPRACCGDASDLLGDYLLRKGYETQYVCGIYHGNDENDLQSHAWLLYNDRVIIDITGDQFKSNPYFLNFDNPVYVGKLDEFHALFDVNRRNIHKTVYIEEYSEICRRRLKKLSEIIVEYI